MRTLTAILKEAEILKNENTSTTCDKLHNLMLEIKEGNFSESKKQVSVEVIGNIYINRFKNRHLEK